MAQIKETAVRDTIKSIKERAGESEFQRITAQLAEETQKIFQNSISPSWW